MKHDIEIPDANLDRWLGRREAFSLIAGRCSAAEVESLRRIRDGKLYRGRAKNWDEFCSQIGVSRRNVERSLRQLEEFGPAFFHLAQLTHITPEEYRAIAAHVTEDGIHCEGEVIAFLPENSSQVAAAMVKLLGRDAPPAARPAPVASFESVFKRCQTVAQTLDKLTQLNRAQKLQLASVLLKIREKAEALGVPMLPW